MFTYMYIYRYTYSEYGTHCIYPNGMSLNFLFHVLIPKEYLTGKSNCSNMF